MILHGHQILSTVFFGEQYMEAINIISIIVTAIATCFIAYYSFVSSKIADEIKKQNDKHDSELKDLYQAIAIATLMGGNGNSGVVKTLISTFNQHYKGKVQIFNQNTDT